MKCIKSPLRYPGGKSKAISFLKQFFPKDFKIYKEPFFGGGSIGLYIAQRNNNIEISVNDINYELFCFWQSLKLNSENLINGVLELKNRFKEGRELYYFILSRRENNLSVLERGIDFFILNRITFSGVVDSGGYSQKAYDERFTMSSIERLKDTKNIISKFSFSCEDFSEFLNFDKSQKNGKESFIFLDPPYFSTAKSKLYGKNGVLHTNFNHQKLCDFLKRSKSKFLLTYDDSEYVRKLYEDFYIFEWDLQYGMNNYKKNYASKGKELLISNYKLMPTINLDSH